VIGISLGRCKPPPLPLSLLAAPICGHQCAKQKCVAASPRTRQGRGTARERLVVSQGLVESTPSAATAWSPSLLRSFLSPTSLVHCTFLGLYEWLWGPSVTSAQMGEGMTVFS
jgi:hypothetical protein